MTVILALRYKGGVLLASDSQATMSTQGQPSKGDVDKLFTLGGSIGWGGAGSAGLIHRIRDELDKSNAKVCGAFKKPNLHTAGQGIYEIFNRHQKQAAADHVPAGGGGPETASAIFAGYCADQPFIFEIGLNGTREFHDQPYDTIGSADIFVWHAIRSVENYYNLPDLNRDLAMALAYRTIDNAIRSAAYGIGGAVQLVEVTPEAAHRLTAEEVKVTADLVDIWKQQEVATLSTLLHPADENVTAGVEEPPDEVAS